MTPHALLCVFTATAALSIGAWLSIFIESGAHLAIVAIVICIVAVGGAAVLEKLFGSDHQAFIYAGFAGLWITVFGLTIIAIVVGRSVFR